ncbi:MAG: threonine--tRNA ligase, partial [Synergistaceae bacterium]|nr:threonine--tRNA ligase [Synergistaceae bacterium]
FPYWLAPVQIKIIPIADSHIDYARELQNEFMNRNLRSEIDTRSEKLGRKIRDAQMQKVPYMLVVGDKEKENHTVGVRERSKGDLGSMSFDDFMNVLSQEFNPIH